MIRIVLAALWVVLFLILSLPLAFVEFIIGLFSPSARAKSSQVIISFAFKVVILAAGTKVIVKGKENIPADTPVLYAPNHRSIFDVVITYTLAPGQTGYVAKKEIRKVPLLNMWMIFMNCQFLDRSNLREGLKVILKCADLVKNGVSICIFPEGTRNKTDLDIQEFHDGCFKIAEKSSCPVVPVAINNTEQIFEAHLPWLKKTTVVIEYCKPIFTADMSREEKKTIGKLVSDEIVEAYVANKALIQ